MSLALGIIVVAVTAVTAVAVLALFVWGAVKDGQDEAAAQARLRRPQLVRARAAAVRRRQARRSR
jgi:hypothetical protein